MNNQQFERLVENLQDIMRCPHCSARYTLADIHYLGQLDSMTFLHMRCDSCHTPVFASVAMANTDGEILPSDLTVDDIAVTDNSAQMEDDLLELGFERHTSPTLEAEDVQIPIEDVSAETILRSLNPIAYDDVLDIHTYLTDFTGDFEHIFS
ncbi:MAG: hypothetical protein WC553_03065 [Patescibacteria group bacterium]